MSRYVIEVVNTRRDGGPVYLSGLALNLLLTPSTDETETRIKITSEQFKLLAYDLEGFEGGKFGVPKQIALYLLDLDTGASERITFEQALKVITGGVNDDAAALADQNKQAAELDRLCSDLDQDEQDAEDQDNADFENAGRHAAE